MTENRRDRLRELLDAVLDEQHATLGAMADAAYASPFHFSRTLSSGAGEPPVALRRRVMLERAAWRIAHGTSVTDAALEAGYESVDGFARAFARAFGHPPSATTSGTGHRLPAPNGVHFHPPTNLWIDGDGGRPTAHELVATLVHHDVADTAALLEYVSGVDPAALHHRRPGHTVLPWDGPEESVFDLLAATVWTKEVWLAAIEGADQPQRCTRDIAALAARHTEVAARWVAMVRRSDENGAWSDRVVDALCEPPESFVLGGIVTHVLTFSAHRRLLARSWLRESGTDIDDGDPLDWLARRSTS
ncbi:helix-turn-helix domain-containing protein [Ruania halotolerans]|uniref:helix-turn-helix domain-containing protein n=1 Tax=Ruania halotolerans TaxID=2897773 RepID=UPI001E2980E9|nr:helix-turn-helix domain-containing protein [Ruania halotolerans]UFU05971.1 helix-turn-helix domain-containing protein [Ruania halotolerans]